MRTWAGSRGGPGKILAHRIVRRHHLLFNRPAQLPVNWSSIKIADTNNNSTHRFKNSTKPNGV